MNQIYNFNNIRHLLIKGFDEQELRDFCQDNPAFKGVDEKLALKASRAEIVTEILRYAEQHLKVDVLLGWAKRKNPTRYEQHQPYVIDRAKIEAELAEIEQNRANLPTILRGAVLEAALAQLRER